MDELHEEDAKDMQCMGRLFQSRLRGRSPAYDEIMLMQKEHKQHAAFPRAWKLSYNLGNPRHVDADATRSVACWLRERGDGCVEYVWRRWIGRSFSRIML